MADLALDVVSAPMDVSTPLCVQDRVLDVGHRAGEDVPRRRNPNTFSGSAVDVTAPLSLRSTAIRFASLGAAPREG